MKALKRVKPQVLVSAKTQGGIQGMSKGNHTTEGSFTDSNLNEVIPLFTGEVNHSGGLTGPLFNLL